MTSPILTDGASTHTCTAPKPHGPRYPLWRGPNVSELAVRSWLACWSHRLAVVRPWAVPLSTLLFHQLEDAYFIAAYCLEPLPPLPRPPPPTPVVPFRSSNIAGGFGAKSKPHRLAPSPLKEPTQTLVQA